MVCNYTIIILTGKPDSEMKGNPVPSFYYKIKEGVTTIPNGSTSEDELLMEVRNSLKITEL